MGSGNSRLGSRHRRPLTHCTNLLSSLFPCGATSSTPPPEMEDHPDKVMVNSAGHHDEELNDAWSSTEASSLISARGTGSRNPENGIGVSSGNSSTRCDGTADYDLTNHETNDHRILLSESKEIFAPYQTVDDHSLTESYPIGNGGNTEASTSLEECPSDSVSINTSCLLDNGDATNGINKSDNGGVYGVTSEVMHPSSSSTSMHGDSHHDEFCIENFMGEVTNELVSDLDTVFHGSGVPVTSQSLGNEHIQESIPSGLGFLLPNREQGQGDGSVLHVDLVAISSNISSGSNDVETIHHEVRRNGRRLFWDAFSRHSSRRAMDASAVVLSTENNNDPVAHHRWLLGFSEEIFDDRMGNDSRYLAGRIQRMHERRRHSRFEIWERLRGVLDDDVQRSSLCPSGSHPAGTCSCESLLTEETSAHASISRIIMLAEALFEVLDEIHRHPTALSSSILSLPAPESVVDSLPVKNHAKVDKVEGRDDVEQCYICLFEYEEGDKIRVLPCHHEYHMSCVDKWLKEINGVCPLCRGDVCLGVDESSAPNS